MNDSASMIDRFPTLGRVGWRTRSRIPFYPQTSRADCGAACLAMVLAMHGKHLRLDEVRDAAGVDRNGADAAQLLTAGRHFGLRGRGLRIDEVEGLRTLPRGCILHWRFQHFVILEGWSRGGLRIVDPAIGRLQVSMAEASEAFTGIALLFEAGEDFYPESKRKTGVRRYLRTIASQASTLTRVVWVSVVLQVLMLALPILTGLVVDRVVPRGESDLLMLLALGVLVIAIYRCLASILRAHLLVQLRTRLDAHLTVDFMDHLIALPYGFFQQRSSGDLLMRINSTGHIRETLTGGALSAVLDGTLIIVVLVALFVTDWRLGLLVVLLAAARIAIFLATRRRHKELMTELLQAQATARSDQLEMLNGIETLKTSGAELQAIEHWVDHFVDELNVTIDQGRLNAWIDALLETLSMVSPLIVLLVGAHLVIAGDLSLGTMLAVSALAASFLQPLSTLITTAFSLERLGSFLERMNDVLEMPKEQSVLPPAGSPRLEGRIAFEGVSFGYGPLSPPVLHDVSIEISPGMFLAIVGPSGSGKSTLVNLLSGLYNPTAGSVLFDGVQLDRLDLSSVRRQLGIVTQHPYLFARSIRENISIHQPGAPLERVIEAAKRSDIHHDIEQMPMGYNTLLANGGASISGGQRQRIALARALFHHPKILILDEATSALDTVSERKIQETLAGLRTTRVVVAHRLSTVVNADLILVIEDGRIVDRGQHSTLLESSLTYRKLVGRSPRSGGHLVS